MQTFRAAEHFVPGKCGLREQATFSLDDLDLAGRNVGEVRRQRSLVGGADRGRSMWQLAGKFGNLSQLLDPRIEREPASGDIRIPAAIGDFRLVL
jgi:hypothetical protein